MSNYPKYFLSSLLAADGDVTIPPASATEAGEGRLSQANGWGKINSTALENGGIAPFREDFNGMMYLLSQFALWQQQGGLMKYSSSLAYETGNEILYNGTKYRALKDNKNVVPGTDPTTWKNMDNNVPAGAVMPFANVKLGGSDGRRPIFWGSSQADESWVFCDGGTAYGSTKAPNLVGRMIRAATVANAGQMGGSDTVSLSSANIPAHTHNITVAGSGSHSHTRGSMNITGNFPACVEDHLLPTPEGAFYFNGTAYEADGEGAIGNWKLCFDASRNWTGSTSSDGYHTHAATCSSTGSSSVSAVTTTPPYYTLAYFVKLPEG